MSEESLPIHKKVRLHCQENRVFTGFVYTIDPVSGNYVLFREASSRLMPTIVCGWAVERVEVLTDELPPELDSFFQTLSEKSTDNLSTGNVQTLPPHLSKPNDTVVSGSASVADLEQRRAKVISLFRSHHIDVAVSDPSEPDLLSISNLVFIRPPYLPSSCTGHNLMVLDRVRGLLAGLPALESAASSNDINNEVPSTSSILA